MVYKHGRVKEQVYMNKSEKKKKKVFDENERLMVTLIVVDETQSAGLKNVLVVVDESGKESLQVPKELKTGALDTPPATPPLSEEKAEEPQEPVAKIMTPEKIKDLKKNRTIVIDYQGQQIEVNVAKKKTTNKKLQVTTLAGKKLQVSPIFFSDQQKYGYVAVDKVHDIKNDMTVYFKDQCCQYVPNVLFKKTDIEVKEWIADDKGLKPKDVAKINFDSTEKDDAGNPTRKYFDMVYLWPQKQAGQPTSKHIFKFQNADDPLLLPTNKRHIKIVDAKAI